MEVTNCNKEGETKMADEEKKTVVMDDRFSDMLRDETNDIDEESDDRTNQTADADKNQNEENENLIPDAQCLESNSNTELTVKAKQNNIERGIIYLSSIPTSLDLQQLRNILVNFGSLGRVYLQEDHNPSKQRSKRTYYTEGWVEFKNKKEAKQTAKILNCSQVGGKKKHPWFSDTWNMKYLPKFKWHHLVDRLAYERAVEEQKMRIEVGAARKEAYHFRDLVDKADGDKRTLKQGKDINRKEWKFYQKQTEEEIKEVIDKKGDGGGKKRKAKGGGGIQGESQKPAEPKKMKKQIQEDKKAKKRDLIKSIFQGGDSDGES